MSNKLKNADDLDRLAKAGAATLYPDRLKILIGSATCGLAMGAGKIEEAAFAIVKKFKADAMVKRTGCIGFCGREPLLDMVLPHGPRISFGDMTPEKTARRAFGILYKREYTRLRLRSDDFPKRRTRFDRRSPCIYPSRAGLEAIPEWSSLDFYRRQKKVILRNCGSIDPMSIEESIARGAYRGALQALIVHETRRGAR